MIFGILLMTKPEGMGGMVVVGNAQSESAKTQSLLTVVPHSHRSSWVGSQWASWQQQTLNSCTRKLPMQVENDAR